MELPFSQCESINVLPDLEGCSTPSTGLDSFPSTGMEIEMEAELNRIGENLQANNAEVTEFEQERLVYKKQLLLCHSNINSIQNKFEELREIMLTSKIQLMIVGETKIDSA